MLVTIIAIFLLAWGPKLIFEIPRRLELVGPDLFHLKVNDHFVCLTSD